MAEHKILTGIREEAAEHFAKATKEEKTHKISPILQAKLKDWNLRQCGQCGKIHALDAICCAKPSKHSVNPYLAPVEAKTQEAKLAWFNAQLAEAEKQVEAGTMKRLPQMLTKAAKNEGFTMVSTKSFK